MNLGSLGAGSKLVGFAAIVAAAFGTAAAVGAAVNPIDVGGTGDHVVNGDAMAAPSSPRGLSVVDAGFRLDLAATALPAGAASDFSFRILEGSEPLTEFAELHERPLHLIVLSRNLVDFLHVHPTMAVDGTWTVELPALAPGSYRVFADFQPVGAQNLTLGADVLVAGEVVATELPASTGVDVVDGYTVRLTGDPVVGDSALRFAVELDGEQVVTEPYLGASGHLVAIRTGDLAFLHVHPNDDVDNDADDADQPGAIDVIAELPTTGTYRLFLDFAHDGEVRTAAFTIATSDDMSSMTTDTHEEGH